MLYRNWRYEHGINAILAEEVHTLVMIKGGIHAVYTDDIDGELLEERKIPRAGRTLGKGVDESGRLAERVVSGGNDSTLRNMSEKRGEKED